MTGNLAVEDSQQFPGSEIVKKNCICVDEYTEKNTITMSPDKLAFLIGNFLRTQVMNVLRYIRVPIYSC